MIGILKKDVFGRNLFLKRWLVRLFGMFFYPRFNFKYSCKISGSEIINNLPASGVLFISNHQTYFADVAFLFQVIQNSRLGYFNNLKKMGFWKQPVGNLFYVAAEETMNSGFLPKLMKLTGAVTVKRTWREKGKEIQREVDKKDTSNIGIALENGWVISFPQGTTAPFSEIRKGTAHIIKEYHPIVIPVVIDGFRRGFDKKGLRKKVQHVDLKMVIKKPLEINYNDSIEDIVALIGDSIEQNEFHKLNPQPIIA